MRIWIDRAAAFVGSSFVGLFLGVFLTCFLPPYVVPAVGTFAFTLVVSIDLATTGRAYRAGLAILVASSLVVEAYVRPPTRFMEVQIGAFDEAPTFEQLLAKSNLHCYRCEEYLPVRIPVPLGRSLSRNEVVDAVKGALPMTFRVGYCGTGVSMRIPMHPIFADFSLRETERKCVDR